jgi:pimeloyl-ACP methyl ester carboxylesterase
VHVTSPIFTVPLFAALLGGGFWLWTPDKSRAELEAKYLAAKSDYIEVAGVFLHLRDTGSKQAPAIILIHGFGASLHTWEPWAQTLAKEYRVIRFDVPGFGLTGPDPTGDYSDQRSITLLISLMDTFGIAHATLIGNSMGGRIAWKFAAAHPERVSKLVLISPDGFASPGIEYGMKATVPVIMKLMRYTLPKAILASNLAAAYADPASMTGKLLDRYYDLMLAPGVRDAIIARMEQSILTDPEPELRRIQAETLLLWGEKDALIPATNAADYVRVLQRSTLVTLPALGHLPQEEAPDVSLKPVMDFLAR